MCIRDSVKASFGEGKNAPTSNWSPADLEIYHDTTSGNSVINASESTLGQAHTGKLDIQKDGTSRKEVNESGSYITGISTFNGDTTFTGASYNALWDKSENRLHFNDNAKLTFGDTTTPDMEIHHDTNHSYIRDTGVGDLHLQSAQAVAIEDLSGNDSAVFFTDAGVQLHWRGAGVTGVKFETTQTGANVGGELRVTDDIIAFVSDIRLKTDIESIDSPLDKVCKLSGFTYKHNETAKVECNVDTGDQRFVGVSAQDVQQVLPEAVKSAPSNNEYLTVQYEKLVPLLIEAIKELKNEVDELKKGK